MEFKLKSPYSPTGDQPEAISVLTRGVKNGSKHQTLLGVTGSGKTYSLANVIQNVQLPTLVISHNKTLAAQLYQELRDYFPDNAVSYFVSYYDYYQPESYIPTTDTYIEKETEINDEIDKLRLSATANLLSRSDSIVVASVSCIYNLGSPVEFAKNQFELMPGMILDRNVVMSRLSEIQYNRSDFELKRGTFRVKGDVITVWPSDQDYALKLSFLGQALESITMVHPVSGQPVKSDSPPQFPEKSPRYIIYPAKHFQAKKDSRETIFESIKHDLKLRLAELKAQKKVIEAYRLAQRVKYDLEMIREFGYVNGIENYSQYFEGRGPTDPPFTLLDYFQYNINKFQKSKIKNQKSSFLTIIDESHITVPQLRGMSAGDRSRKQTLIDFGFRLPSALSNRPLTFDEIIPRLPQIIYASATPNPWELELSKPHIAEQLIRPTGLVDPQVEIRPTQNQIPDLVAEIIKRVSNSQRVLVTTLTKRTAETLTEYLNDSEKIKKLISNFKFQISNYPKVQYLHADVATLDRQDILDDLREGNFDVVVGINLLREGLDLPEVSLVAILEADKEGFLRSKTSLIQTMGRAARHVDGRVIMYADKITPSMQGALSEVERRRQVQLEYNQTHHITPIGINKPIRSKLMLRDTKSISTASLPKAFKAHGWQSLSDIDLSSLTPKDLTDLRSSLVKSMNAAAKKWDFDAAANYKATIIKIDEFVK